MKHFVGLDMSVKETSICVVKGDGEVILQTTVPSEPRAIVDVLAVPSLVIERIGLEAGPLSEWLYAGLVEAGLPAICVETRHMHAALSAQINKTDRNDALGIAQMMSVGLYKAVHVKTSASQRRRVLLTSRKLLQRKVQDLENELRGILKTFGLKVGVVGKSRFEARVRELVAGDAVLEAIVIPVLTARAALQAQYDALHRMVLDLARRDPICRRLMTAPGVGPVVALTYRTVIDNPARFAKSRSVGAHIGLTPRMFQSGEVSRMGRVSRSGDAYLRSLMYEAALILRTGSAKWSSLKAWRIITTPLTQTRFRGARAQETGQWRRRPHRGRSNSRLALCRVAPRAELRTHVSRPAQHTGIGDPMLRRGITWGTKGP